MLNLRFKRNLVCLACLLFTAHLAGCNSGATLTPTKTQTHPLVGQKSGDLRFVRSLSAPQHVLSGQSQPIFNNDLLEIDVFQVDELDRTVRVDSKGMISLPLIGSVKAAERTVTQLERQLKQRYGANYLKSPEISVFVKESNGQRVVVDGSVARPGLVPVTSQTTLLRVVAEAGGLTELADENKLFVYRKYKTENQVAQYSLANIRKGLSPDPTLYAGDVVVAFTSDRKIAFNNLKEGLKVAGFATRLVVPF